MLGTVEQAFESYLRIRVSVQRHHFIPVRRSAPVILDGVVGYAAVRLWLNGDGIHIGPFGTGSEVLHRPQREVDVRTGGNLARQLQFQTVFQDRTNHQQRRDILRTDVSHHFEMSAFQWLTYDVEWRIALFLFILYISSEVAQGIYQDSNRAVLHALCTCDGMLARCS